jgi:hypothetical protein
MGIPAIADLCLGVSVGKTSWSSFFIHLFICAYIVWAISPLCPLPSPSPPYPPCPLGLEKCEILGINMASFFLFNCEYFQ